MKVTDTLWAGASAEMVEVGGKHAVAAHPDGRSGYDESTLVHPTAKPCGLAPVFVRVSVTVEAFWVVMTVGLNPVSLTERSIVEATSFMPSLSG
jgi:hypothetical protein